jgi:hypothetical protein
MFFYSSATSKMAKVELRCRVKKIREQINSVFVLQLERDDGQLSRKPPEML